MAEKTKCCKSFKKKGKACKSCPLVNCFSEKQLRKLAASIKKEKARNKFEDRYLCSDAA